MVLKEKFTLENRLAFREEIQDEVTFLWYEI